MKNISLNRIQTFTRIFDETVTAVFFFFLNFKQKRDKSFT